MNVDKIKDRIRSEYRIHAECKGFDASLMSIAEYDQIHSYAFNQGWHSGRLKLLSDLLSEIEMEELEKEALE